MLKKYKSHLCSENYEKFYAFFIDLELLKIADLQK